MGGVQEQCLANIQHDWILAHPRRPQTAPVAEQIAEQLQAHGVETWVYAQWTEPDVRDSVKGSDLVVAMVVTARCCGQHGCVRRGACRCWGSTWATWAS